MDHSDHSCVLQLVCVTARVTCLASSSVTLTLRVAGQSDIDTTSSTTSHHLFYLQLLHLCSPSKVTTQTG